MGDRLRPLLRGGIPANLVEAKGRLFRKILISDPAAVESLRERHEELRAARGAYLSDCLNVVLRNFNPSLGD